jgi:hypothetical protein
LLLDTHPHPSAAGTPCYGLQGHPPPGRRCPPSPPPPPLPAGGRSPPSRVSLTIARSACLHTPPSGQTPGRTAAPEPTAQGRIYSRDNVCVCGVVRVWWCVRGGGWRGGERHSPTGRSTPRNRAEGHKLFFSTYTHTHTHTPCFFYYSKAGHQVCSCMPRLWHCLSPLISPLHCATTNSPAVKVDRKRQQGLLHFLNNFDSSAVGPCTTKGGGERGGQRWPDQLILVFMHMMQPTQWCKFLTAHLSLKACIMFMFMSMLLYLWHLLESAALAALRQL